MGRAFLSFCTGRAPASAADNHETLLAEVRRTGIALEEREGDTGEPAVAAVVSDASSVVAVIGVAVSRDSWPPREALITALSQAAQRLSTRFGGVPWPPVVHDAGGGDERDAAV
jgi:DNA-binding IclR family transcriptional regulator